MESGERSGHSEGVGGGRREGTQGRQGQQRRQRSLGTPRVKDKEGTLPQEEGDQQGLGFKENKNLRRTLGLSR